MRTRRIGGLLVVAWVLASACAVGSLSSPAERGPYAVAEVSLSLNDIDRNRGMDVLVVYPAEEEGARRPERAFPLILFHHGFLLRGDLYRSYGEHLASHGFVVVLPTLRMALFGIGHAVLAADVRYVLDSCLALDADPSSALHGLIDETAVGASGHSLGGKLALLEAATDPRVRAIAVLDPVDVAGPGQSSTPESPSVAPELMPQIAVPLLLLGAGLGGETALFTPCAPAGENYEAFFEAAHPPAIEVVQLAVGHGQYVDPGAGFLLSACARGAVPDDEVRASSAAYLTAFFLGHLAGEAAALEWLDERLVLDAAQGLVVVRRK
ncbi:MAG: alpha/beta hydrolase family protein [Candidatus Bipolaricaulia bacterium]